LRAGTRTQAEGHDPLTLTVADALNQRPQDLGASILVADLTSDVERLDK
jgi:hypothetical protein